MSANSQLDDPFSSGNLQALLNDFSSTLCVINDMHRIAETHAHSDATMTASTLIVMRRYLDDFDSVFNELDALVRRAKERENDGKREKGGTK